MKKLLLISILATPLAYAPELIPPKRIPVFGTPKEETEENRENAAIKRRLNTEENRSTYYLLQNGMLGL